ncbi:helix-turn-helix transcriptional regulator [Sphaerospermopsis aphanizomenoides BCCUSP55]|uniref:helix-turn-helix domain-containing protein n=1 Tax=Sphaerospermopsis aphanizomenoides TaxID=459663 RepID=UPI001F2CA1E8|nr:helix-turn-helix transcriptional regulator [Sphaerospermopsis aphanizomenoides]MBK1990907.1 helix-turn-helix transcriptional regulator [Sphaerospermopsis aphanizomenoides BCCUSP55]
MKKTSQPKTTANHNGGESPLTHLRNELGLTQEEFGRTIGVSLRTVSRWEAGVNIPSFTLPQLKALDRLLRLNGKTIQDLPDSFAPISKPEN